MTDRIELLGVRAFGYHGVLVDEKRDGQEFVVDVVMDVDIRAAARRDDLTATVNYADVAQTVHDVVSDGSVDLIETLADRIADAVLVGRPRIRCVEVAVHKPHAPIPVPFADVVVRHRKQAPPVSAVLALGSNLGDRRAHLHHAVQLLDDAPGVRVTGVSPVFETDPVGGVDQDDFLNAVVAIETELGPDAVLDLAHAVEQDARRERLVRWGPRTLDVDVIVWGDLITDDPVLTLPHPRAHERAFVLSPWLALNPEAVVPGAFGGAVADLVKRACDRDGVRPAGTLNWPGAAAEGRSQ
ncbi:2-amino-4-hydroxy-6-hydroxymethyldihydropteridine diphosphokinase [Devriesea agamarum]|uniref:2-amino-4-hydroxy-6- hydroxymethyldihydropteridine diphosphokinase n=1 Tax=Devriesea agamarum TaxID=472569 RepID=UPI00071E1939|nr:2-amino-4-hydroxy-6-hydroxymethyldihydropteridine diphosphokinase [Devriesea agamarum]